MTSSVGFRKRIRPIKSWRFPAIEERACSDRQKSTWKRMVGTMTGPQRSVAVVHLRPRAFNTKIWGTAASDST